MKTEDKAQRGSKCNFTQYATERKKIILLKTPCLVPYVEAGRFIRRLLFPCFVFFLNVDIALLHDPLEMILSIYSWKGKQMGREYENGISILRDSLLQHVHFVDLFQVSTNTTTRIHQQNLWTADLSHSVFSVTTLKNYVSEFLVQLIPTPCPQKSATFKYYWTLSEKWCMKYRY